MRKRWLLWTLGGAAATLATVLGAFLWIARPSRVTALVRDGLATHLQLDVSVDEARLQLLPRPVIHVHGLALRAPGRHDLPPLVAIDALRANIGPLSLVRKRVHTVQAEGLRITVPPGEARTTLPQPGPSTQVNIIVSHFVARDASLEFVRGEDKAPLTFAIHALDMQDVGFGLPMPFEARLTNPVPEGEVTTTGTFGPMLPGAVVDSPLDGDYIFENANLATINGIGGTLQASGRFSGTLRRIAAGGQALVPDFSLELGGRPQSLTADFDAVITGTSGTTVLERVDAVLSETRLTVEGAVLNLEGPANRSLEFEVKIDDGRIEDILALVLDAERAAITGDVTVDARMTLPPGETPVVARLTIDGRFGLEDTRFTSRQIQARMEELSRRSQGKNEDDPLGRVMTDVRGRIRLSSGVARLSQLTFQVPGARVQLDGSYGLVTGRLDFRGTLRMQASMSDAVGGFKSIFLKPFNPLFRKDGAGAVIPIKIGGHRDKPELGVEFGRVF